MHEIGLCESVLDAVRRRAGRRRVTEVTLRVGALHRVVPESMEQAFELVSAGTQASGAELRLVHVPVRAVCAACGGVTESDGPVETCPDCGAVAPEQVAGDELLLESIRVDDGAGVIER